MKNKLSLFPSTIPLGRYNNAVSGSLLLVFTVLNDLGSMGVGEDQKISVL